MNRKFPLQWPAGYARTQKPKRSAFKVTPGAAQDELLSEVKRLGGKNLIVSTDQVLNNDGSIRMSAKEPSDKGVAIYFDYKGKPVALCCDQYNEMRDNLYALAKSINAIRGIERWGVSDFLERAFTGFTALPEAGVKKHWHEVLGVSPFASFEFVKYAWREKIKYAHPDAGGNAEKFNEINSAYEEYKELHKINL